ncbi:glycosyltransferase family 4 protein [Vibrio coralliirubri]|uniref:glycosyltransferase family 4 protein n=1 Tax=Vibrio coralliirubri TaxID=1516159 RepID=UPI0006390815|nr:glycosyltransferase family 4 protein [Vibrio coralliirubri]CDU11569.1 hypothetical protein VCR17J2_200008 [Vibrio coralliirubri]
MLVSNKERVVYVLESWHNAGTEQYVYLLAKELKKKNYNIELIILGSVDPTYLEQCKSVFSDVIQINSSGKSILKTAKSLYLVLKQSRAKKVHFHLYSNLLLSLLSAKLLKMECVITFHTPLSVWSLRHKIAWLISSFLANKNIAVAEVIKSEFRTKKIHHFTVINPPVNMISQRIENNHSTFRIIGVGRLSNREKDWPRLIEALHILNQTYKRNIHLTICGGGPDAEHLNRLVHSLNLQKNCLLTGHVDKETIEQHLASADLFVLPSKFEGFGIAPVEAMQIGLPTITANYPASQDYITHDVTGWTFSIGDAQALATLIKKIIEQPAHTKKVARVGQVFALDKFSPKKIAQQHIAVYRDINNK